VGNFFGPNLIKKFRTLKTPQKKLNIKFQSVISRKKGLRQDDENVKDAIEVDYRDIETILRLNIDKLKIP
jgi:hypothetical protein